MVYQGEIYPCSEAHSFSQEAGFLTSIVFLLLVTFSSSVHPQVPWSSSIQLTFGSSDDSHPSFVEKTFPGGEEMLAFSRSETPGKNICVLKTQQTGAVWDTTVHYVTSDSVENDFPAIAGDSFSNKYLLVWQRCDTLCEIFYSVDLGTGWSVPGRVPTLGINHHKPRLMPKYRDFGNTFHIGMVCEQDGRVVFAEFRDSVWTAPEFVTPVGDTGNYLPQLNYVQRFSSSNWEPLIVWERQVSPSFRSIYHSFRHDTGWVQLGILGGGIDEYVSPRFVKNLRGTYFAITYTMASSGFDLEIHGAAGDYLGPAPLFWDFTNFTPNPTSQHGNASFTLNPIVTLDKEVVRDLWYGYTAGTWRTWFIGSDSIALLDYGRQVPVYRAGPIGFVDQHPDISGGTAVSVNGMRVWSVWESNASGSWKLYGSTADLPLGVSDEQFLPPSISLFQNYPNPFNPTTEIKYQISEISNVVLKVYDVLGREVTTLVNERVHPGKYRVMWDASSAASGVYYYRLHISDGRSLVRKMVVIR